MRSQGSACSREGRHPREVLDLSGRAPRVVGEAAALPVRADDGEAAAHGETPPEPQLARPVSPRPCGEMTKGMRGWSVGPYHRGSSRYALRGVPLWRAVRKRPHGHVPLRLRTEHRLFTRARGSAGRRGECEEAPRALQAGPSAQATRGRRPPSAGQVDRPVGGVAARRAGDRGGQHTARRQPQPQVQAPWCAVERRDRDATSRRGSAIE